MVLFFILLVPIQSPDCANAAVAFLVLAEDLQHQECLAMTIGTAAHAYMLVTYLLVLVHVILKTFSADMAGTIVAITSALFFSSGSDSSDENNSCSFVGSNFFF